MKPSPALKRVQALAKAYLEAEPQLKLLNHAFISKKPPRSE